MATLVGWRLLLPAAVLLRLGGGGGGDLRQGAGHRRSGSTPLYSFSNLFDCHVRRLDR